jgi:hypothetical protein
MRAAVVAPLLQPTHEPNSKLLKAPKIFESAGAHARGLRGFKPSAA